MMHRKNDIGGLISENLAQFLNGDHWDQIPSKRSGVGIYRKVARGKTWEVVLPSVEFSDFEKGIRYALEIISEYRGKGLNETINEFLLPQADTLKLRLVGDSTKHGNIPLRDALHLFEGAKNLLLSAASDEEHPLPFHERNAYGKGLELLRQCQIGQTEVGSFIANLIIPIDLNLGLQLASNEPGFGRKVSQRLMKNLSILTEASASKNFSYAIEQREQSALMSSNFVESVARLLPEGQENLLEISIENAPLVPFQDQAIPLRIKVEDKWVPQFRELAKKLRTSKLIATGEFVCEVKRLEADPVPSTRNRGKIVVVTMLEGKKIKANATLAPKQYELAAQAHNEGKKLLLKGKLVYSGRSKTINAERFDVLH
jgi:hypothetical protein